MDPTTQFLAAENSATLRRYRALYRSIVASPFVLILAIGLVGHIHGKPHFQPTGTRGYDHRVLAYRDRVVAVGAILASPEPSRSDLEREAHRWVAGLVSGELSDLRPAFYEDHLRDGPRGEVLRAGIELSTTLALRAEEAVHRGDSYRGAYDGALAAETSHGLRNFEVAAFLQCLLTSRRGIGVVASAWSRLSPEQKDALRPRLRALTVAPGEIEALRNLERRQTEEYQVRQGSPPVEVEGLDRSLIERNKSAEASSMTRSVRLNNARLQALISDAPGTASLR